MHQKINGDLNLSWQMEIDHPKLVSSFLSSFVRRLIVFLEHFLSFLHKIS